MSRVPVILTVLKEHELQVFNICETKYSGPTHSHESEGLLHLVFEEVLHGNLPFLHNLRRVGVAFNAKYGAGDEFGEGTEYSRYSLDGDLYGRDILASEQNPPIQDLIRLIDKPDSLRRYILEYHKSHTVPPLDQSQIQNGKRWQLRLLTDPTLFP